MPIGADETLLLDILQQIQGGIDRLEEGQVDLAARMTRVEFAMLGVRRDALITDESLAHTQVTIDRIERRLDLVDEGFKP